jgi:hypothetical protein
MLPTQNRRHRGRWPLYSCTGLPLRILAAGCWTVGSWPTGGVRTDQSTSAHHDGQEARSWLDDIEEVTRAMRDLSHREGPGMRMTNLQTAQVIDASHRVLGAPGPGRVQQLVHLHMRGH